MTLSGGVDGAGAWYGLAWWGLLCACYVALVAPAAWRDWRRAGQGADARAGGGRRVGPFVVGVALLVVGAAVTAALVTPWRGENDVPGAGRVLAALLVGAGVVWGRRRAWGTR